MTPQVPPRHAHHLHSRQCCRPNDSTKHPQCAQPAFFDASAPCCMIDLPHQNGPIKFMLLSCYTRDPIHHCSIVGPHRSRAKELQDAVSKLLRPLTSHSAQLHNMRPSPQNQTDNTPLHRPSGPFSLICSIVTWQLTCEGGWTYAGTTLDSPGPSMVPFVGPMHASSPVFRLFKTVEEVYVSPGPADPRPAARTNLGQGTVETPWRQ